MEEKAGVAIRDGKIPESRSAAYFTSDSPNRLPDCRVGVTMRHLLKSGTPSFHPASSLSVASFTSGSSHPRKYRFKDIPVFPIFDCQLTILILLRFIILSKDWHHF